MNPLFIKSYFSTTFCVGEIQTKTTLVKQISQIGHSHLFYTIQQKQKHKGKEIYFPLSSVVAGINREPEVLSVKSSKALARISIYNQISQHQLVSLGKLCTLLDTESMDYLFSTSCLATVPNLIALLPCLLSS